MDSEELNEKLKEYYNTEKVFDLQAEGLSLLDFVKLLNRKELKILAVHDPREKKENPQ